MKKLWLILVAVLALTLLAPTVLAAEEYAADGFTTLSDAISNATPGETVTLLKTVTENVTVSKDLCIDLKGSSINGVLTVEDGCTVTVKDSETDDYTVSDGIYGKIAGIEGKGDVVAAEGYLMIREGENAVSFHKLTMTLTAVVIRPSQVGMYYETKFAGDEVIKENLHSYGVAVSAGVAPNAQKILEDTAEKTHASFAMDKWAAATENTANSLLLKGIMKPDNGYAINKRNAGTLVYGAAYVRIGDTVYIGTPAAFTLQQVVTSSDAKWNTLTELQKSGLLDMLSDYENILNTWTMPNARAAAAEIYKTRPFKVLTLGHSLARDAGQMLAKVAQVEGTESITVATLYYSGCTLQQHYNFMINNKTYTTFDLSGFDADSPEDAEIPPVHYQNYTMYDALTYTDWDIIIMQNGVFTSGLKNGYDPYLDRIIEFVNQHKTNPKAKLIWNMTWTAPEDPVLLATSEGVSPGYQDKFEEYFGTSADAMYNGIVSCVQDKILTRPIYTAVIPSGTALMNARTSYLEDGDLYRDYIHANDYGRLLAAYTWYSVLTGKKIEEINMDAIPAALRYYKADREKGDLELTADMKAIIVESVQNAIANPYQITQSKITTAPSA